MYANGMYANGMGPTRAFLLLSEWATPHSCDANYNEERARFGL
jgi:hypothetical protein